MNCLSKPGRENPYAWIHEIKPSSLALFVNCIRVITCSLLNMLKTWALAALRDIFSAGYWEESGQSALSTRINVDSLDGNLVDN